MARDILEVLDEFVPAENPRKWAKLASTVDSRRLELLLLKEILIELRKLNQIKQASPPQW
ncbi:MAG: hypothetical protein HY670_05665 [Chloroflexi bacterium]|nr:hypothetical protein [Chloroflexota bacterium]